MYRQVVAQSPHNEKLNNTLLGCVEFESNCQFGKISPRQGWQTCRPHRFQRNLKIVQQSGNCRNFGRVKPVGKPEKLSDVRIRIGRIVKKRRPAQPGSEGPENPEREETNVGGFESAGSHGGSVCGTHLDREARQNASRSILVFAGLRRMNPALGFRHGKLHNLRRSQQCQS